jgi:hypothetical protein
MVQVQTTPLSRAVAGTTLLLYGNIRFGLVWSRCDFSDSLRLY